MVKRQLEAAKPGVTIPSNQSPRSQERQYAEAMEKMVLAISKQFENQVLKELNKSTIQKFEDAQVGNYAAVYISLSKKARNKILKRFDRERIKKFTETIFSRADKASSKALYEKVEKQIGINSTELLQTEGLTFDLNALILESVEWAEKLRNETLEEFTAQSLRLMTHGEEFEKILNEHRKNTSKRKNHAQFIARNQLANYNSVSNKLRAQNLGIDEAIWVTARGLSRKGNPVRRCHKVRDGKKFKLSEGLYSSCDGKTLLPGVDFNCRCTYEFLIPSD